MSRISLFLVSLFIIFSNAKEKPDAVKCKICGYKEPEEELFKYRVVNGDIIDPKKYPWLVSIAVKEKIFCSGSLISSQYILTAAHCAVDPSRKDEKCKDGRPCLWKAADLEIGVWDEKSADKPYKKLKVSEVIPHPDYDGELKDEVLVHDIALLKLAEEVQDCTGEFGPICLMTKNDSGESGDKLMMAGWGFSTTKGPKRDGEKRSLRKGTIRRIPSENCTDSKEKSKYSEMILCAVSYDEQEQIPCEGDSGSSTFKEVDNVYYSLGVGSTIMRHKGTKPCTLDGKVKYTKVAYYMKWIKEHVKELPKSEKESSND